MTAAGGYTACLNGLNDIGTVYLVDALAQLDLAIENLDDADGESAGAFSGGAGLFPDLHMHWTGLYNTISPNLRKTRESLDLSRQAILAAEKRYRALEGEG